MCISGTGNDELIGNGTSNDGNNAEEEKTKEELVPDVGMPKMLQGGEVC